MYRTPETVKNSKRYVLWGGGVKEQGPNVIGLHQLESLKFRVIPWGITLSLLVKYSQNPQNKLNSVCFLEIL